MEEDKTGEPFNLRNTYTPLFISQIRNQVYVTDAESKHHSFQMKIRSDRSQSFEIKLNRCCIMGYVTSLDIWLDKKFNITVDDGTDSIRCLQWIHSDNNSNNRNYDHGTEMLSIGQLVEVKGRLHMHKEFKELIIESLSIMVSHLQECHFWMHCIQIQNYIKEKCMNRAKENDSSVFDSSSLDHTDENEELFGHCLYEYLNSVNDAHSRHFTVSELVSGNDDVDRLFNSLYERTQRKTWTSSEKVELILRILNQLLISNYIINTTNHPTSNSIDYHAKIERHSSFQVLMLSQHLVPAIIEYIKVRDNRSNFGGEYGVSLSLIVKGIKSNNKFSNMDTNMIHECIKYMVDESIIYETDRPQYYRVL